jgi:hypothetical protein
MSNIVLLIVIVLMCISTETAAQPLCGSGVDVMGISELRVLKTRQCVDIHGTDGSGNIQTYRCDGYRDQQLIMCEDGTIRNLETPHNCITLDKDGILK